MSFSNQCDHQITGRTIAKYQTLAKDPATREIWTWAPGKELEHFSTRRKNDGNTGNMYHFLLWPHQHCRYQKKEHSCQSKCWLPAIKIRSKPSRNHSKWQFDGFFLKTEQQELQIWSHQKSFATTSTKRIQSIQLLMTKISISIPPCLILIHENDLGHHP